MNKQKLYILISSIIGVLSALMPWVAIHAFGQTVYSVPGINSGGATTMLCFGMVCFLCFVGNKQDKFTQQCEYGLWVLSGLNIFIFMTFLMKINDFGYDFGAFANVSAVHGSYLTFLASLAIILFSVEQIQLVDRVDGVIKNFMGKKVVESTQEEVVMPVKEVIVPVVDHASVVPVQEVSEVVTVEEGIVENVVEKEGNDQIEVSEIIENEKETGEQMKKAEITSLEKQDADEMPSVNKKV